MLLPRHVGSIVDELDRDTSSEEPRSWEMEAEANRFAAEVLMPTAWAKRVIGDPEDMSSRVTALAQRAEVSIDAAALKALRIGPAGFVLARSNGFQIVWSGGTDGTLANPPRPGSEPRPNALSPTVSFGTNIASEGSYLWWRVADQTAVPPQPAEDWRTILTRIIYSVRSPDKLKTTQSVNGIISAANSSVRENRTLEKVYSACLQRVQHREDTNPYVTAVLAHPEFMRYVIAKVYTLKI